MLATRVSIMMATGLVLAAAGNGNQPAPPTRPAPTTQPTEPSQPRELSARLEELQARISELERHVEQLKARIELLESVLQEVYYVTRGPEMAEPPRESARSLLLANEEEAEGYGLYSYVLFGSPPSEAARERYIRAIEAYLELMPEVAELSELVPPEQINITYLPVKIPAPEDAPPEWFIENYNYSRARAFLNGLPGGHFDGPYIVSALKPLSRDPNPDKYIFQDLSSVPPHLVRSWVKEFMRQAAKERFWEEETARNLVFELRKTIGIMAEGLPDVRESLNGWLAWIGG